MNNPFDIIYCPFYETDVSICSEMIERLGTFSLFVLMSISNDSINSNSVDNIIKATNLKPSTILETIDELINNGLLAKKSNSVYSLTVLGEKYVRINEFLENYSQNCKVAVNAFTGIVEEIKNENYLYNESPNKNMTLPIKVNKILMRNHDFSNIKDFMKNKMKISEINISNDDYDYIFFNLKPQKKFYVPYIITEKNILHEVNDNEYQIALIIPIEKITKEIKHPEVEKRKDIIKQLIDISYSEETLLSDEGQYLIRIINKIQEQQTKEPVYYECYSGMKIKYEPNLYEFSNSNIPKFKLSRNKRFRCETYENNGFIITDHSLQMDLECIVSFNDLVQME